MYIINPLGQLVGTLTSPTSTVGLYNDPSPSSTSDDGSVNQQDNGDNNDTDGWNSPYPSLLPLASQPDAIDLVAQSMKGYEPPKSYLSSSSSTSTPSAGDGAIQDGIDTDTESLSQVIPQPDSTWGQMTGSRMTTSLPIPIPTDPITAIATATPTSAITITSTATATATLTPAEGWGEWVTGVPTALPTTYGNLNGDWDDGAVGSEMVPQTSSGLA
ncbi:hypothetical protein V865_004654 [Kwoniella europaea PYCC6329]|uniref:Uncharacterized protein n=1 Tax=Kwoniella europaea PYCC6329 TaxID=1423913 RepID=A0AAX4KJ98_9TREE